jgi:hypothetical protein
VLREDGLRVLTWVGRAAMKRHCQLLPQWGERKFVVRCRGTDYLIHWRKYHGLRVVARRPAGGVHLSGVWLYYEED